MSVNLSSKQFAQPDLVEQIDQILARDRDRPALPPAGDHRERDHGPARGRRRDAPADSRSAGIRLSMDDFGTGYSSLSYLHQFPIDILKIDRSFVSRIGPNGENSEIVETIVALAHNLGMEVVAEGVETAEQGEQLRVAAMPVRPGLLLLEAGSVRRPPNC